MAIKLLMAFVKQVKGNTEITDYDDQVLLCLLVQLLESSHNQRENYRKLPYLKYILDMKPTENFKIYEISHLIFAIGQEFNTFQLGPLIGSDKPEIKGLVDCVLTIVLTRKKVYFQVPLCSTKLKYQTRPEVRNTSVHLFC